MELNNRSNRSGNILGTPSSSSEYTIWGMNIIDAYQPFVMVCTGLLTLSLMMLGYLYLQRKALRDAARERQAHLASMNRQAAEGMEQEEEDEGVDEDGSEDKSWPIGKNNFKIIIK